MSADTRGFSVTAQLRRAETERDALRERLDLAEMALDALEVAMFGDFREPNGRSRDELEARVNALVRRVSLMDCDGLDPCSCDRAVLGPPAPEGGAAGGR